MCASATDHGCLAVGGATDSVHRLIVAISVAAETGDFQQGVHAMRG